MKVPDGDDWVEFMLYDQFPDLNRLGVFHHIGRWRSRTWLNRRLCLKLRRCDRLIRARSSCAEPRRGSSRSTTRMGAGPKPWCRQRRVGRLRRRRRSGRESVDSMAAHQVQVVRSWLLESERNCRASDPAFFSAPGRPANVHPQAPPAPWTALHRTLPAFSRTTLETTAVSDLSGV